MSGSNIQLINDLDQIDWNNSGICAWKILLKVLRHANTMNDADRSDQLLNKIASNVESMLNNDILLRLWCDICSAGILENEVNLLNAHRMIANVLREKTPECASQHLYNQSIIKSLINYIENANEMGFNAIETVLSSFSEPYLWVFAVSLCGHTNAVQIIKKLMNKISPYWSLNLSKHIIKYISKQVIDASTADIARSRSVVTALIEYTTQQSIPTAEIIDNLIIGNNLRLQKNDYLAEICDILAATVVNALVQETMPVVVDVVAGVWGDRTFVSTADIPKQTLYTQVLIHSLQKSKREYLYLTSPSKGVTLDLLLSLGISNYLDIDNIHIRKHGMKIAQIYAGLLGETLHFAELDEILQQEKQTINKTQSEKLGKIDIPSSSAKGKISTNTTHTASARATAPTAVARGVAEEYDSDSSVELAAYKLDDGGSSKTEVYDYKDKLLRTTYLRDCLQMLRCPDSKPEARQQLQAALERIPLIMASNPPDALDLCQPLMHELLVVSNAFNIPDFDQQRSAAVQSVLQANPTTAVPFLTSALLGSDLPLGLKLAVLEWLVTAAKTLSNIPGNEQLVAPSSSGNSSSSSTAIELECSSKTTIKRPGMLAAQQKRTHYFRNHFGPLAPLFIYPLMQLLGKVYNNTLNETTRPHSAQKFNLIAELFEPKDSHSEGGGVNKNGVQRDDELKHLDGVDALLPSQCLVALGTFVQCAINTPKIRDYALEIATVAGAFRQASAVALRRAALFALRLSFEAYLPSPTTATDRNPRHRLTGTVQQTPLQALQNISPEGVYIGGDEGDSVESGEAAMLSIMTQPALVSVIDWAASTWKTDPDEVSRALKHDIVTMAVNGGKL